MNWILVPEKYEPDTATTRKENPKIKYIKRYHEDYVVALERENEILKTQRNNAVTMKEAWIIAHPIVISHIKFLEKDLKMCREIGVEMQRRVNRALSKVNLELKEQLKGKL